MSEKKKYLRLVTPKGRAIYPHLNAPDTKFNSDGVYTVKIGVPAGSAGALIKKLDEAYKEALKAGKEAYNALPPEKRKIKGKVKEFTEAGLPYVEDTEKDEVVFSFKMNASYKNKAQEVVPLKPALFDAKGKPINKALKVGGGSLIKVSFEVAPYFALNLGAGVSLRLNAVQILELKEFGQRDAAGHGFDAEDGFSADDDEDESAASDDFANEGEEKPAADADVVSTGEDF